ncbi:MAG: energy-coupling factor ABC transporter ATP-binding protein [Ignavibacteriales bacterium]
MDDVVSVRCLKHIYPDRTEVSLCGLDFVARRGERVVVLGANGSGKTTLLMHLTGLLRPVQGEVRVLGVDPSRAFARIRNRVGVVLQNVNEQIVGPTVWDDVAFGPRNAGVGGARLGEMVEWIIREVGIGSLRDKIPHYLSGGEKKKVAIAGAMISKPEILILDEPFDGLDARSRVEILDLVNRFNEELGTTLIMTTHDVDSVPLMADSVYLLAGDGIAFHAGPKEVLSRPEVLREANLQPPILVELAFDLERYGVDIGTPLTVGEARDAILRASLHK